MKLINKTVIILATFIIFFATSHNSYGFESIPLLEEVDSNKNIKIAFNNDDAPFSFILPNGKPAGLYIDI